MNCGIILFTGLLSICLYHPASKFFVTHQDFLYYGRVTTSNLRFGVENTGTFYNWMSETYPKTELYHFTELWTTGFGKMVNRQHIMLNYYFFALPIYIALSFIGIKDLLQLYFNHLSIRKLFVLSSFIIFGLLFFMHPWDVVTGWFGDLKLPQSGMGTFVFNLKSFFVLPVVIGILLFLNQTKKENFVLVILVSFLYVPVFFIVVAASLIFALSLLLFRFTKEWRTFLFGLLALLLCAVFYKLQGGGGNVVIGLRPQDWLLFQNWWLYGRSIGMGTLVMPLVGFLPVIFYFFFHLKDSIFKYYVFLLYIVCISVWMLFVRNIDANQAFRLLFGALLPLLAMLFFVHLLLCKRKLLFAVFFMFYIVPGLAKAWTFSNSIVGPQKKTDRFLSQLRNQKILYIPGKDEIHTIYDCNERVYTGINSFFLSNDQLELASVSAAVPFDTSRLNNITVEMYRQFRSLSPYYRKFGYFKNLDYQDLKRFVEKYQIDFVCTRTGAEISKCWRVAARFEDYTFYTR